MGRGSWFVGSSWPLGDGGTLLGCWRPGDLERQREAKEQGHELDAGRRRAQKKEEGSNEVTCRRRSSSRSGSWENVKGGYVSRAPALRRGGGGSRGLRRMRRGRCVHSHHAQVCLCPRPHPQANGKAALRGWFYLLGAARWRRRRRCREFKVKAKPGSVCERVCVWSRWPSGSGSGSGGQGVSCGGGGDGGDGGRATAGRGRCSTAGRRWNKVGSRYCTSGRGAAAR